MRWLTATRALAILVALVLIMGAANLMASRVQFDDYRASQQREQAQQQAAQRREQAAQRKQGQAIERKLCLDLGTMAAIVPPAGDPAVNPSRSYEQAEHRAWSGLYDGLACTRAGRQ